MLLLVSEDFTAIHRNSRDNRVIKGRTVPPSVTVRLSKISKKDSVLRSYRNYNQAASEPQPVKIKVLIVDSALC